MKGKAVLTLFVPLIFILLTYSAKCQAALKVSDVRASFDKFNQAFLEADVAILETLLAKNYVHVNGGSGNVINKQSWLKWIAFRRAEVDSGDLIIDTYEVNDIKIQIFGETAVVTGIVKSTGKRQGKPFNLSIRFTNVWLMEDGILRRAAFHDSHLP